MSVEFFWLRQLWWENFTTLKWYLYPVWGVRKYKIYCVSKAQVSTAIFFLTLDESCFKLFLPWLLCHGDLFIVLWEKNKFFLFEFFLCYCSNKKNNQDNILLAICEKEIIEQMLNSICNSSPNGEDTHKGEKGDVSSSHTCLILIRIARIISTLSLCLPGWQVHTSIMYLNKRQMIVCIWTNLSFNSLGERQMN